MRASGQRARTSVRASWAPGASRSRTTTAGVSAGSAASLRRATEAVLAGQGFEGPDDLGIGRPQQEEAWPSEMAFVHWDSRKNAG